MGGRWIYHRKIKDTLLHNKFQEKFYPFFSVIGTVIRIGPRRLNNIFNYLVFISILINLKIYRNAQINVYESFSYNLILKEFTQIDCKRSIT